ncbi:MAG: biopolymer transporter ExbD [Verrucomicrobiales bacterium]|nr:biopolymer transporter ExbD [Verrucomicrobiales bacterium]
MARRRKPNPLLASKPNADMSPMIDLVFLILIFFMIASTAIRFKQDKNVAIPVADKAAVPEMIDGRILINVYPDGSTYDEDSRPVSLEEIEQIMARARSANPNTRLHLRADKSVRHEMVKKVIQASSRGGVNQVIFSTYVTDK